MSVKLPDPPLKPWAPADAASLVQHANDHEVWRFLRDRFPHPYTARDAGAWISRQAAVSPPLEFAITLDGQAVGGIGLVPGTDVERVSAEVGYWLGRAARGKGLATQALHSITAYAFEALGLLRVWATPFGFNTDSVRVLERVGYTREGILRDAAIKEGRVADYLLYATTLSDFRRRTGPEAG